MITSRFIEFIRDDRGAAAAEMALILPLLMVIMFAGIEGGYFMWSEHKVVKGVRDGARYAGRQPFGAIDCDAGTVVTAAETAIMNVTRTGYPDPAVFPGSDIPAVPGWTNGDISVTISCDDTTVTGIYEDLPDGAPRVTVTSVVDYPSLFGVLGFPATGLKVSAESEAAVMGI
jgi:Flp pilus assembly pilin Flp